MTDQTGELGKPAKFWVAPLSLGSVAMSDYPFSVNPVAAAVSHPLDVPPDDIAVTRAGLGCTRLPSDSAVSPSPPLADSG